MAPARFLRGNAPVEQDETGAGLGRAMLAQTMSMSSSMQSTMRRGFGMAPGLAAKAWSWMPPCFSSPVTCPSTVAPSPRGMATNWRMVPLPDAMPSSQGCTPGTT